MMWRSLFLSLLIFLGGQAAVYVPNSHATPSDSPNYDRGGSDRGGSSSFGLNPLIILELIRSLDRRSPNERVDLSPEIAEIRGNISRLYLLLANQYLLQNQLPQACDALERSYTAKLEGYLSRRLDPASTNNLDCFASELGRISQITGSPTALVFPVILSDRIEILFVPPDLGNTASAKQVSKGDGQPIRKVNYNTSAGSVETVIQKFAANLQDPTSNDYLPQAQQLYNWIVRPIEADLEAAKVETIIFVMDGGLRVIPPAALHDGNQFLAEKYASASVITMPLTNREKGNRPKGTKILAMGLSEAMQGLSALPSTLIEVETIASQVLRGNAFLNQDFTIAKLKEQQQQQYNIIHLATHAQFLGDKPKDSFIQVWQDRLRLDQIRSMNMSIDLLTLSACQTAVGQNLGLSGAAIESGAKTTLASLWSISDVGTAPLMMGFYRNFPTTNSKAIALQQAQQMLLQGTVRFENGKVIGIPNLVPIAFPHVRTQVDLRHPFFWSSFILIGNWL